MKRFLVVGVLAALVAGFFVSGQNIAEKLGPEPYSPVKPIAEKLGPEPYAPLYS